MGVASRECFPASGGGREVVFPAVAAKRQGVQARSRVAAGDEAKPRLPLTVSAHPGTRALRACRREPDTESRMRHTHRHTHTNPST